MTRADLGRPRGDDAPSRSDVAAMGRWWLRAAVAAVVAIPLAALAERNGWWWLAALIGAVLLAAWSVAAVAISVHALRWVTTAALASLQRARARATGNGYGGQSGNGPAHAAHGRRDRLAANGLGQRRNRGTGASS